MYSLSAKRMRYPATIRPADLPRVGGEQVVRYRRGRVRCDLPPDVARRASEHMEISGQRTKQASQHQNRNQCWHTRTPSETIPPTRKEPHEALPTYRFR